MTGSIGSRENSVHNPLTIIQRAMNLVMPLGDPSPTGKARLVRD